MDNQPDPTLSDPTPEEITRVYRYVRLRGKKKNKPGAGRPAGHTLSAETRARMAESARARHAKAREGRPERIPGPIGRPRKEPVGGSIAPTLAVTEESGK